MSEVYSEKHYPISRTRSLILELLCKLKVSSALAVNEKSRLGGVTVAKTLSQCGL